MTHILRCHDISGIDIVRAENCHLHDRQGRMYIDFESGCWAASLGHGHARINQALKDQIDRVMHLGTRYPNALAEAAALDVLAITGLGEGKCVFLSSGSEVVEFGVQTARRVTGRPLLLTFASSYLAAFGSAGAKNKAEWLCFDWKSCPHEGACGCLEGIPFAEIGAFVFEPGGSGSEEVKFPRPWLVRETPARTLAAGGLLVMNEITTGMGRTGKWFGFEHYDLRPDIVALGKGLGNGYPVSAAAMRREVAERLEAAGVRYAQSHQNDPLGAAAAHEVIAVMREGDWVAKGAAMGAYFVDGMRRLGEKHPSLIKEARGRGMLLALELQPSDALSAAKAAQALFARGFMVAHNPVRNFLRFDPALTMPREDVDAMLAALDEILGEAETEHA